MRSRLLPILALLTLAALPAAAHNRTLFAPNKTLQRSIEIESEIVFPSIVTDAPATLPVFTRSRKLASGFLGLAAEPNIQRALDLGQETRLGDDYMHARYYNPNLGRFLSVDPVIDLNGSAHEPQKWNRYAYVTNNPLKFVDPNGKERAQIMLDQDVHDLLAGRISEQEYSDRLMARGVAGAGAGLVVGAAAYGPPALGAAAYYWAANKTAILLGAMGWGIGMTGGPVPVRTGQIGEELAGITASKLKVPIPGTLRTRIPDELTKTALREIKNVAYQARTMQLRDFLTYAQNTGIKFILEVRSNTKLTKPLQTLVDDGLIELKRTLPER